MTPIFQVRCAVTRQISSTFDSSITTMDSDYPCPLSGGLRVLLQKDNPKLSQNPRLFNCSVLRATQCILKAVFIRDCKFEACDKCLQMDGEVFYAH